MLLILISETIYILTGPNIVKDLNEYNSSVAIQIS